MIAHVIANLHASSGGPTTAVVELAREQAGTGESVRVIVDEAPADPAPILGRWSGRDVRFAPDLKDLRPRVVHLHGVWDPILRRTAATCAGSGLPWVVSSHGMLHPFTLGQGALKKRVSGDSGHLSNEQSAQMLRKLASASLHTLVLAHLSEKNNRPELAREVAERTLGELGIASRVRVLVASQDRIGENLAV